MTENPLKVRTFSEDVFSWIKTIVFLAACGAALNWWLTRPVTLSLPDKLTVTEDARIAILGYDLVVSTPDGEHVDEASFRKHLSALKKHGYQPVRLSDVYEFYTNGTPLPAKSVLLTFDHGYLETYESTDPILHEFGWPAAMFVLTHRQEARNNSFLYWDRLGRMVASGIWEIGTNGHHETTGLPSASIAEDFTISLDAIAANLQHVSTVAYSFTQRVSQRDPVEEYRSTLSPQIPLFISDDLIAINDRHSSPARLTRIRIGPSWSGDDVVRLLEAENTKPPMYSAAVAEQQAAGLLWRGGQWDGETLTVTSDRTAAAVVPGARWADDWIFSGELSLEADNFSLGQTNPTTGEQWVLEGQRSGLALRTHSSDGRSTVVGRLATTIRRGETYTFKLIKRGSGVVLEWGGASAFARPLTHVFKARTPLQLLASRKSGNATITLRHPYFAEYPLIVKPVSAAASTMEIQSLIDEAATIAAISPMLFEWREGSLDEMKVDRDLFEILGDRYQWQVVPSVRILDETAPSEFYDLTAETFSSWSGIHFDLTALPQPAQDRWLQQLRGAGEHSRPDDKTLLVSTGSAAYVPLISKPIQ